MRNETKEKKYREIEEGEESSGEYLMGSDGVYWSMWQCRLFHLVIQLLSHLVDVPASIWGAQACTQKAKVMDPRRQACGTRLQTGKIGGFSGFRCASTLVPTLQYTNLEVRKPVSIWLKVKLQAPNSVTKSFLTKRPLLHLNKYIFRCLFDTQGRRTVSAEQTIKPQEMHKKIYTNKFYKI